MIEFIRIILLLGIIGAAVTFAGSAVTWWMDDQRKLRRLVRKVLGGPPDGVIVASGRGAAAAFRLASQQVVVMRGGGAETLVYRLHALNGAELIVDNQVAARAMRDEPRRVLDQINTGASEVTLRLLFDDPRHPDFSLELWIPRDGLGRDARPPTASIREARGWLARAEAIMRRAKPPGSQAPEPVLASKPPPEAAPPPPPAPEPAPQAAKPAAKPARADDRPPWEEPDSMLFDVEDTDERHAPDDDVLELPVDASGQPRLL